MYSIELIASISQARDVLLSRSHLFVYRHEMSGGRKTYEKKNAEQECKIRTKKSGCGCHIIIKLYPTHQPF
jgi:hypothetical protein